MTPIDFTICTALDVIARSLACHPSLFADAIKTMTTEHATYAANNPQSAGANGARMAAESAWRVIDAMVDGTSDEEALAAIGADTGMLVQAFTIARKLNLVPAHCVAGIMERSTKA